MAIRLINKDLGATAGALNKPSGFDFSKWGDAFRRLGKPVKPSELIFFTSQLSLMMEIGTPLNNALRAFANQTQNQAFKEAIQALIRDIEEGRQLSDAMQKHPRIFNNVFTSMVKAGETGGFLKDILDRIVEIEEKRQAMISQLKNALSYPAVLCIIGLLVIVFVMVGVLPKFTAFFQGKEDILPMTTLALMAISASLKAYWWLYIIAAAGLAVSIKLFMESRQGKILIDRFLVAVPPIAGLSNKIFTCDLLRIMGNLMESQVPILDALKTTRGTLKNYYFRQFLDEITAHVEQGGKFSQPFATNPYILPSVKEMVVTGEEAGNLSGVMLRLARFYDTEVDRALKTVATMIEPIALLVMGGVIGIIVSAVILPIFKLSYALH